MSKLTRRLLVLFFVFCAGLLSGVAIGQEQPPAKPAEEDPFAERFDFGAAGTEAPVEHTFMFKNEGTEALEIANVQMSPPLVVTRMSARVAPGETGRVTVRLGTPREVGEFKSPVVVKFKGNTAPEKVFWVVGRIVAELIEMEPYGAFFVAVPRGETKQTSIEIINHAEEPLEIRQVEPGSARYTTELETLEPGKRYRLTLTLKGEGPGGKQQDYITVVTSSPTQPFLRIQANTYIKERVYTFPDALDFGTIQPYALKSKPNMIPFLHQTLMVYQVGGKNFQVSASTDIPFLQLAPAASSMGDRYQIEVRVVPEKLQRGTYNGHILIVTNDPEFPRLEVPVRAVVDSSW